MATSSTLPSQSHAPLPSSNRKSGPRVPATPEVTEPYNPFKKHIVHEEVVKLDDGGLGTAYKVTSDHHVRRSHIMDVLRSDMVRSRMAERERRLREDGDKRRALLLQLLQRNPSGSVDPQSKQPPQQSPQAITPSILQSRSFQALSPYPQPGPDVNPYTPSATPSLVPKHSPEAVRALRRFYSCEPYRSEGVVHVNPGALENAYDIPRWRQMRLSNTRAQQEKAKEELRLREQGIFNLGHKSPNKQHGGTLLRSLDASKKDGQSPSVSHRIIHKREIEVQTEAPSGVGYDPEMHKTSFNRVFGAPPPWIAADASKKPMVQGLMVSWPPLRNSTRLFPEDIANSAQLEDEVRQIHADLQRADHFERSIRIHTGERVSIPFSTTVRTRVRRVANSAMAEHKQQHREKTQPPHLQPQATSSASRDPSSPSELTVGRPTTPPLPPPVLPAHAAKAIIRI